MSTDRLPSTGRRPALGPSQIQALLERYFSEGSPSLEELRQEFRQKNSKGEERALSLATVRKYLKAAGVELPRGKAAVKERAEGRVMPCTIRTMMNRIPTEMLIGAGQTQLLERLLERGEVSQKALAAQFGISKDRVRRFKASLAEAPAEPVEAPEEAPETVEPAPEVEAEESPAEAEAAPEAPVETEEA